MPIRGLTDQKPRLPRVGKLHLGWRDERQVPHGSDHFIVREDNTTPGWAAAAFFEVYGEAPKSIDVMFPSDDVQDWCDPYYRLFSQSWQQVCKGDGETAQAKWDPNQDGLRPPGVDSGTWANKKTDNWVPRSIPCLAEDCPQQQGDRPACRMSLNLFVLLPKVRGIGCWQVDSRSIHGVRNLLNSVALVRTVTGGRVRGVPLTLSVVPRNVSPPGVKTKTVYVLELSMPGYRLEDLVQVAAALPEKALLAAPVPPRVDEDELADAYTGEEQGADENGQGGGEEPQGSVEAGLADSSVSPGPASAPDDVCVTCKGPVEVYDADGRAYCQKHAPIEHEPAETPLPSSQEGADAAIGAGAVSSVGEAAPAAPVPPEESRQPMLLPDKNPPKTLGELLTRANRDFGYLSGEVWRVLGQQLKPDAPLVDLARAWDLLRQKAVGPVAAK